MTDIDAQQIGRHEAQIANLEKALDQVANDVHAIRKAMDEMRGGWKVAIWISGVIGGMVTLIVSHFWGGK